MTFEDLLSEIELLRNLPLKSLGRGASITVTAVNRELGRVELEITGKNAVTGRSFKEIRSLWEALCAKPLVHVDSALLGSGTSRNQPETIFANLPFIEYLVVNKRKHICLISGRSHEAGTVKAMDPIRARELVQAIQGEGAEARPPSLIIVSSDMAACVKDAENICGNAPISSGVPGIYSIRNGDADMLLVDASVTGGGVVPGCYPVIVGSSSEPGEPIFDAGLFSFSALKSRNIKAVTAKRK